jgi:4-amino-4-deoxy-L-arabinose transferase-like glycosyltransferase
LSKTYNRKIIVEDIKQVSKKIEEIMAYSLMPLLACWVTFYGMFHILFSRLSKREVFLLTSLGWGTVVVAITEGLSLFHQLAHRPMLVTWSMVAIVSLAGWTFLLYRKIGFRKIFVWLKKIKLQPSQMSWLDGIMLGVIILQVVTLFMVALVYPPTNADTLTYHLARVMHWQQNHSVTFYATNIDRQIQMPPFAEFVMAQFHILVNNDLYDNLVQWFAMLISLVGVSLITKRLGGSRILQITATLLCVSIPMGILQASGTQNDYVVSAWLVCLAYFGLKLIAEPDAWITTAAVGVALGLAILTKATAFVFAFPLCIWIGIALLAKRRWSALINGLIITILFVGLNAGHFSRNFALYRSVTGPQQDYRNETFTPAAIASNLIRNIDEQVRIKTDIPLVDQIGVDTQAWFRLAYQMTGLDTQDPRTTFGRTNIFLYQASTNEGVSGSPFHVLLILLALIVILFRGKYRDETFVFFMVLTASFFLFSAYLKWQVWGPRLQLPLLVLWSAVLPLVLFRNTKSWLMAIPVMVALYGFYWTFNNSSRPITPEAVYAIHNRSDNLFLEEPELRTWYNYMADFTVASGCQNVGLRIDGIVSREYPIWVLLRERGFKGRIEHVEVTNPSQIYTDPSFKPCAVFSLGIDPNYENGWRRIDLTDYYLYLDTYKTS